MSLNGDTYGSSLLGTSGIGNVCADAPTRYPEVGLDEVARLAPDLVLLPTSRTRSRPRHVPEVAGGRAGCRVVLVDGRDLFWWGIRTPAAVERLRTALSR